MTASSNAHVGQWNPDEGWGAITLREAVIQPVVSRFKTVTAVLDYDRETSELVAIRVMIGPHERKDV